MSVYQRWILPRLTHLAMSQSRLVPYRRRTLAAAQGRVLEIGVGSGLNLPLYGAEVVGIYGVDPSLEMLHLAEQRAADAPQPVTLLGASAEDLPLEDRSVDTVVTTWTLCTIADPIRALGEMRRVLKPDGQLLFVEHGLSPDPPVARWQHRLTPCWRRIGGGCHLNRKIDNLILAGGFRLGEVYAAYMPGPRPFGYLYEGWARP